MFWKKKCKNCKEEIKDKWNFCANCGASLIETFGDNFEKQIEDIHKELRTVGFPQFKFKPHVKTGGVRITITSGSGMQPKVEVKTSDGYKKHIHEIKPKFGDNRLLEVKPATEIKVPKIMEEPETKTQRLGNKQIFTVTLPEVKEEDVQIKQLEQSIEIRAIAGDKGYFKLIPVPANAYVDKEFKDGILKIQIVK